MLFLFQTKSQKCLNIIAPLQLIQYVKEHIPEGGEDYEFYITVLNESLRRYIKQTSFFRRKKPESKNIKDVIFSILIEEQGEYLTIRQIDDFLRGEDKIPQGKIASILNDLVQEGLVERFIIPSGPGKGRRKYRVIMEEDQE